MDNLYRTLSKIGRLPPEQVTALRRVVRQVEVPAKTLLQRADRISDKIYFVERGIARTFYYRDGKDITHWIALENDFVGSMASFFLREPSNKLVETLEPCVLWEFEYRVLEAFFSSHPQRERMGRLFANYGVALLERRFDHLHFRTAKERYAILLAQHPELLQRVPLGIIASYLGITQATLSRIRARL